MGGSFDWVESGYLIGMALILGGSWVIALEWRWRMVEAQRRELAALAMISRYRDQLARCAVRALGVRALHEERDLAIAECGEREARESAQEREIERLRAAVNVGSNAP